jgi:hypothetical protein
MPAPTEAERLRRRDYMRRRRAELREAPKRIAATLAWSFEAICEAVGLQPSPQSQLNPARWHAAINLEGLNLCTKSKRR